MARQSRSPTILLTRPLAQSRRFAQELAGVTGLPVVISPLMAPVFLAPRLPDGPFRAVILTSETGALAAGNLRAALPGRAYCVGARTAEAARAAGFGAIVAGGDAAGLVATLSGADETGPLLHLRGRDSRGEIAGTLTKRRIVTHEAVIYDQQEQPLSDEAQGLLAGDAPLIVPLFSPRSAVLFAAQAQGAKTLWLAALSPAVAAALGDLPRLGLEIAEKPEAGPMLLAVQRLIASATAS
jgi:uroporphyrinogen-III synthase